ncbi:MAG: hypothetical protein U0074_00150 [Kouleothrix sp.]
MTQILQFLFWGCSCGDSIYIYCIPCADLLFAGDCGRESLYAVADITPPVSMIIAAHNEAANIAAKLDNVLAMDYPREQFEVIVALGWLE